VVGIADVSNTLFWPSFSLELVTVINSVNNGLVRNSGVSHSTLGLTSPPSAVSTSETASRHQLRGRRERRTPSQSPMSLAYTYAARHPKNEQGTFGNV
jgi:hypothetical protein